MHNPNVAKPPVEDDALRVPPPDASSNKPASGDRYHYMDALRAFCLLCGIPYHAGLIYSAQSWRVNSPDADFLVENFSRFLTIFRMPTFMIIAGFFAAMMLSRKGSLRWIRERSVRLWVPCFVGILVSLPVTLGLSNRTDSVNLVAHLWFLASLFWISCLYVLLRKAFTWMAHHEAFLYAAALPAFLCLAIANELFLRELVGPYDSGFVNVAKIVQYLPFFFLGTVIWENERFRASFLRLRLETFVLALAPLAVFLVVELSPAIGELFKTLTALFFARLLMALAMKYVDAPRKIIQKIAALSLPIYVLHLPIIVGLGVFFLEVSWHPIFEWAIICTFTLLASGGFALLIEKSRMLTFAFEGRWAPRRSDGSPAPCEGWRDAAKSA